MSNDAKLGLVLGIGLVILIGIVYFRRDPGLPPATAAARTQAGVQSASSVEPSGLGAPGPVYTVPPVTPASAEPPTPRVQVPAEPEPLAPSPPRRSR